MGNVKNKGPRRFSTGGGYGVGGLWPTRELRDARGHEPTSPPARTLKQQELGGRTTCWSVVL